MKLILSRKGFDSAAGGCPSALLDGRPVSFPIPTRQPSPTRYGDLTRDIATLVTDLTKGRITREHACHLDPDLDAGALPRLAGWRGALGQVSTAQTHLANNRIAPGDLFLFWGLFRAADRNGGGRWHFTGPAEHRIFGWLQIDEILTVGEDPTPALTTAPLARLASAPRHRLEQEQHRLRRARRTRTPRRARKPSRLRTVPHRCSPDRDHEPATFHLVGPGLAQPTDRWHRTDLPSAGALEHRWRQPLARGRPWPGIHRRLRRAHRRARLAGKSLRRREHGSRAMRIHTYVIATDAGSAPNYDPPFTTLAVCKPRIRRKANVGELVLAFAGKSVNPLRAALGRVGRCRRREIHVRRLLERQALPGQETRSLHSPRQLLPPNPRTVDSCGSKTPCMDPKPREHDTDGLYVLAFNPSWRFGANGPPCQPSSACA